MSTARRIAGLLALLAIFLAPAFSQGPVQIETGADLPDGRVNVLYTVDLSARRGNLPYSWFVISGTLPPGVALVAPTGTLTGTPTSSGQFTFTIRVTDRNGDQDSRQFHLTIIGPPSIQTTSLPGGTAGTPYSATLSATGGQTPYTWTISAGALPAGISLNASTGVLTGTPTTAGNFDFTVRVTDAGNQAVVRPLRITVDPAPLAITTATLPNGTIGQAYNATLAASGGTPPYNWTVSAGALPGGLSLSSAGAITGSPTSAGNFDFTARVTATGSTPVTKALRITVNAVPLAISTNTLPSGTVGQPYSGGQLAATGGTSPYAWIIETGQLPAGLSLAFTGAITGTPSAAGDFNFTVRVTDAASQSMTKALRITINPTQLSITTTALSAGMVGQAYTGALAAAGGTPPYTWTVSAGALPAGLSLSGSGITGAPTTPGDFDFTVRAVDTASQSVTKALRITINPAQLSITTTTLSTGTVGQPYNATLAAAGGTPPYTWTVSGGALPGGLSISGSGITGTPTTAGDFDFTVRSADAASQSATKALRITVSPAQLSITTTTLSAGTVGQAYNATLAAVGGTPPYTWTVSGGALPGGLSISGSGITGTPTAAGDFDFTVRVSDTGSQPATKALRITINAAQLSLTTATLSAGTVGQAYNATLTAAGGTPPYTWTVSGGALPGGLSISGSGITGTPTAAGDFDFTVRVGDSASQSATKALRITIGAAPPPTLSITTNGLAAGVVGQGYNASAAATGGTPPYTWSLAGGALPGGVSLSAAGAISGTPTTAGDFDFTLNVSDAASKSATKPLRITIAPAPATPISVTTTTLGSGSVGQAYTGTLAAIGGTPPYSWTISAGALPAGLTLATTGGIGGTPTTAGDFDLTVRAADSAGQAATRQLRITITALAPLSITTIMLPRGSAGSDYSQTLAATGGRAPYTWAATSGQLPNGLTLDASTGRISGSLSAPGSFQFTIRVTDADARTAERSFTISVTGALSISGCPTATGTAGVAYSSALAATGGATPYSWSVVSGQMPPGITLNVSTGVLSGNPILAGNFAFTLNVSDAVNQMATRSCAIAIANSLQIQTDSLPDATTRATYSQALRAVGGTPPYRWFTTAGSLPPGLSLDETTGSISGQPTQPGRFTFTLQVLDSVNGQTQRSLTILVGTGLAIPSCPGPLASVNQAYTSTVTAVGGQSPYTWSLDSGTLPAGLRITSDSGVVSGTPTTPGTSSFSVRAIDSVATTVSRSCSIEVTAELTISTSTLPAAETGAPYNANLTATGGSSPYTWNISAGALSPGLTLNSATGQISGSPIPPGVFRFTARVTDAAGAQKEKQLEINVASGFAISACPNPAAVVGDPYSSSMTLAGGEAPLQWEVASGALPAGLVLDAQAGTITGSPSAVSTAEFVIRVSDARSRSTMRSCAIAVGPPILRITGSEVLPDAMLGVVYQQSIPVAGGRSPYSWSLLSGSLPDGFSLASSGVLSGTAATPGRFQFTVRVADADGATATRTMELRAVPAAAPTVSFGDLPDIVQPAQQPRVRLAVDPAYPVPLRGKLTLRFTPDPGLNVDDPAIRFVTGERSVDFDIAANATEATFPVPQFALQTGSVAGTIDLNVTLSTGDLDVTPSPAPTKAIRIDRTAPVITNVRINPVANGFEVLVTGFSTTREVTSATFQFTPAAGSRLDASQVVVQTDTVARQWFGDARSAGFGGQFTFTQPFTVQNASLSEVSVTLTSPQGTSQPTRARF